MPKPPTIAEIKSRLTRNAGGVVRLDGETIGLLQPKFSCGQTSYVGCVTYAGEAIETAPATSKDYALERVAQAIAKVCRAKRSD